MLRCKRLIWNCANVVIIYRGFCFTKGLVELRKKGVFGAALIKKCRYWPANIKGDAIDAHFSSKEVGNVDAAKKVVDRVAYCIFCMKEPYCVMKLMSTYGTLDPTDKRTRRKFKRGGIMDINGSIHTEVVANCFLYRNQVDYNNNWRHASISIEITGAAKYWPGHFFAWYLAIS